MTTAVWTGPARAEAVAVLANMTVAALGGGDERRVQDRSGAPVPDSGGLPAAVLDGPGPQPHRVHDAPVRAGRAGRTARVGAHRCRSDRHRFGGLGSLGCGPRRVRR